MGDFQGRSGLTGHRAHPRGLGVWLGRGELRGHDSAAGEALQQGDGSQGSGSTDKGGLSELAQSELRQRGLPRGRQARCLLIGELAR